MWNRTRSRGAAEGAEESWMRELDDITGGIVDAALRIHRDLGPGLLESVYETVLARALDSGDFRSSDNRPSVSNTTGWCSRKDCALTSWLIIASSWNSNLWSDWRLSTASSF